MARENDFQIILVRYGEIALKSSYVRSRFEDILMNNIQSSIRLAGFDYKVKRLFGRLVVEGFDKKVISVLKHVFGIVSFSPCILVESDMDAIRKESIKIAKKHIKKSDSFAVRCKRSGIHTFNSRDIDIAVGSDIVKKIGCKVDLTKPDTTIGIDVREKETYIYIENIRGIGGVPVGAGGRVITVIKDFNGVIASWLFMKRGSVIIPVFIGKNKKFLKILEKWHTGHKLRPYFIDKDTTKKINRVLEENKYAPLVTGEILGDKWIKSKQVIFRPLVGFGKKELERMKNVILG